MVTEVNQKGYTKIIGSYELKLTGATKLVKPIDVTFDVGTEYNRKMAYILHKKADGSYERFEEQIKDGKVTITVSELSPFVVAVKEKAQEEQSNTKLEEEPDTKTEESQIETEQSVKEGEKDDTPKTGTTNNIYFIIPLTVITALGIMIYCKKQNK